MYQVEENTLIGSLKVSSGGSGGSASWGSITGTLSNQTDLQTALDSKQDVLVSGTNIKTVNGNSVLGNGNIAITTYQPIPLTPYSQTTQEIGKWRTKTMEMFMADIIADPSAVKGMAYMSTVGTVAGDHDFYNSDIMPTCCELKVEIMQVETSGTGIHKIAKLTATSTNNAPYIWTRDLEGGTSPWQPFYNFPWRAGNGSASKIDFNGTALSPDVSGKITLPVATTITSASTNAEIPTAKAVYDSKVQAIQYSTMPTAGEDNQDKIIEYIGDTANGYTNGYFYRCSETIDTPAVQESLIITQGENTLLGDITYDINIFKSALQPNGAHTYLFSAVGYPKEISLSKYTDRFEFMTLNRDSVFDIPARLPISGAMYSWVDGANNYYYTNTSIPNEDTIFYLSGSDISQPGDENSGWIYVSTTERFDTGYAIWQIGSNEEKIELADYGLYCVTSPFIGDTLQVTYTPATQKVSHYNWVQIDVQPSKTKLSEFTNDIGFITENLTKQTTDLTNIISSGSGTKKLTKYGDLVHLNFNIYVSSITANTLYTLGKIPNGYRPDNTYYSNGAVYEAQSGNIVGTLKLEIKTNGDISVKTNVSSSTMPVLGGQATWFING